MTASPSSTLGTRVRLALAPGGRAATAWWLLKRATGLEAYKLVCAECRPTSVAQRFGFHVLSSIDALAHIDAATYESLERHTPRRLPQMIQLGFALYFIERSGSPVCQLLASPGESVVADTPPSLHMQFGARSVFISYVYTHSAFRRLGAATELLRLTQNDLAGKDFSVSVAHVSATNVASLRAFARADWRFAGSMVFTPKGKLVFARQSGPRRFDFRAPGTSRR